MSEEKNKKNFRKTSLLKYLILIGALILVLIYIVIPHIMDFRRRMNIKKDLESVYPGYEIEIDEIRCDKKPTYYESDLKERSDWWFIKAFPEEGLYYFSFHASEDYLSKFAYAEDYFLFARGYATKDGTVIFDTYAGLYYADASASYFETVVDFEHNFPELDYYISKINGNPDRYVQTHECTTFEGYRKAKATYEYSDLYVSIVDGNVETVEEIKKILQDADFDMYVNFSWKSANASGEYSFGESLGNYIPFREIEDRNYHLENGD